MKDDKTPEHNLPREGRRKWLILPRDVAAYYYGRLLQIQDEKRNSPERPLGSEDGELDMLSLQQLQIVTELEEIAEKYPADALSIAKYFDESSNTSVKHLGMRLREKAKQRANDLLSEV